MSETFEQPRFKVAAVQSGSIFRDAPKWFDLDATLDKSINLIEEAGRNGARLIVFPECHLPCYPHFSLDLSDRITFNEMWAALLRNSVEVPSKETDALCDAAKRVGAYIAMGINERDKQYQGRMYNSVVYISPQGEIMGTHRKIVNTVQERFFHTPGEGGENLKTVFKTGLGNIGGSICGEHCQLLLTHNWIVQGIQVHCSLWPGQPALETHQDIHTRALCYTAHCFGVSACGYIAEKDWPKKFYSNSRFNVPGVNFRGGSGIVSPLGEYIAGPVYDKETIVYGDINMADLDKSRSGINLVGIYSRWDLLNVNVRQEKYEPLVSMDSKSQAGPGQVDALEERLKRLEERVEGMEKGNK